MPIDRLLFSQYIKGFNFRELFNEMGWNNDKTKQPISVDDITFLLQAVAEKSGFKILLCNPTDKGLIPDYNTRKKIETKVTKLFQEHLIIFYDAKKQEQIWQLVVRQSGKPTKVTETRYHISQDPELLYQRASGIFFEMDEEEKITIVDVTQRMAENFHANAEKVTKQFYDKFKKEHTSFLDFIKGINEKINKEWYASLMLNRLMFCYFIQKKGFLDNNKNYLREKLKACQVKKGENKFYSFYRDFLLVLFHQGLNEAKQKEEVKIEIGKIPYLNGGLFDEHELEKMYNGIDIEDKAFERIFDFFDQYEWHLDTRITATGKDINPDVIGYIFEKYINDRSQMGAYYTKEDITEYISKNCILPYLFDETKRQYPKAFNTDAEIWHSVKQSDDTYIYDAVKKGIDEELPLEISAGIKEVSKRTEWNKPAPANFALPTEIWREVIDRRNRYNEVKSKISNGEIQSINDFITYNLNIRQFAQDTIENTNYPDFLKAFYKALNNVTIIDPTCGSGAFLFAAMNILEPLYDACIRRMEIFVCESKPGKYKFFEETLQFVKAPEHPNLKYFIFKSIILRNLYGVDIMKEAVEIAKLRLFLKLVATVDANYSKPNLGLEPLPDIDFNIRSGNTLVGFAKVEDAIRAVNAKDKTGQMGLVFDSELDIINSIKNQADDLARVFKSFKNAQLDDNLSDFKQAKDKLMNYQANLNATLNEYLAFTYDIDCKKQKEKYKQWLIGHDPFNWFAEFYEIIHDKGGFNCVIGNPPYVELKIAEKTYKIQNQEINNGGNLHSVVAARGLQILHSNGKLGFIVPVAISNTDRMETIRKKFISKGQIWVSNYAIRPGKLFSGAEQRLSIYIFSNNKNAGLISTSKYFKWNKEEREALFENISLTTFNISGSKIWLKIPNQISKSILEKIHNSSEILGQYAKGDNPVFYKNTGIGYYITATLTPPICYINSIKTSSSRETTICFENEDLKFIFYSLILSNTFFLFYHAKSNCRDLNPSDLTTFKFPKTLLIEKKLIPLSKQLQKSLDDNSWFQIRNQKQTGEVKIQSFTASLSKPIIDEIDKVLAVHYGFTAEELDFIINYDIKYRMGKELENGEDE